MQLGCRDESRILDRIWEGEKAFLDIPYRANQRKFILDTYHWLQYFYDKPVIDKEFPAIQKDLAYSNRILYGYGNDYVRIKLRTLLKQYGYKRRSQLLLQHINRCMLFYHLGATLRGGVPCSIEDADLDQMLTFRVV